MRLARLFPVLFLVPILLLALTCGTAFILLNSEAGVRFLASRAEGLLKGQASWREIEGTIAGPLVMRDLEIRQPGLKIKLQTLSLDWSPTALAGGLLQLGSIKALGLRLAVAESDDASSAEPLDLSSLVLPIAVAIDDIQVRDIHIEQEGQEPLLLKGVDLEAQLDEGKLTLARFTVDAPVASVSLSGTALFTQTANFDLNYRVTAGKLEQYDPSLPPQLTASGELQGELAGETLTIKQLSLALAEAPLRLELAAEVEGYTLEAPSINVSLQWQEAQWPLADEAPLFYSTVADVQLTGTTAAYDLDVSATLAGTDIPAGEWQLKGSGDLQQLTLRTLRGGILGGEVQAQGIVQWHPLPHWELQLSGHGVNPGQLDPAFTGSLLLDLRTTGQLDANGNLQASAAVEQLGGTVSGYPLELSAQVDIQGKTLQVEQLQLASGDNRLKASGIVAADSLALDWEMEATDPASLVSGAAGRITAQGHLAGTPETPTLRMQLRGTSVQWDTLATPQLSADILAGPGQGDPLQLAISTGPIQNDQAPLLERLELTANGSTSQHTLALVADSGSELLRARLEGGLSPALTQWQGRLARLSTSSDDIGDWHLVSPSDLTLSATGTSLARSCLQNETESRLCASGRWSQNGSGTLEATLRSLPVSTWVPSVTAEVNGQLKAGLAEDGSLWLKSSAKVSEGTVAVTLDQSQRLLPHGGAELTATIDHNGFTANTRVNAPEQGVVDARVKLPALTSLPLAEHQPLEGQLKASLPGLEGLAAWIPEVSSSSGRLDSELKLSGSLEQPRVQGHASISDGAVEIPMAGLKLHQIELQAVSDQSDPEIIAIRGGMQSGRGQIGLSGQANTANTTASLALTGDRFQVFNTRDARVLLSPDLQIDWSDTVLKLRGDLTIPKADITPQLAISPASVSGSEDGTAVPGQAIAPSADVVVVNGSVELETTLPKAPIDIDSQIRVVLGDKVNISAAGFVSGISGAVTFTNTPRQVELIPNARGRFNLENGTFRSFGQDLDIETGQIIFADVPADEPEINLRAVRWIDNDPTVTAAGVLLTGSLTQPALGLFSRPQLEPSEVQTYLLTGRSSGSKDNVLSIGTYVSPRIYVGYGYNMLEKTSEFNSLFSITPRYGVGANLGEADNNINMTFTYER